MAFKLERYLPKLGKKMLLVASEIADVKDIADGPKSVLKLARFDFDFDVDGGTGVISLRGSPLLPTNAVIWDGLFIVDTLLAGGAGSSAALSIAGADDLVADTVVGGAPWSTTGNKAVKPVHTAAKAVVTTTPAAPALTITVNDLTQGKFRLFLLYFVPA